MLLRQPGLFSTFRWVLGCAAIIACGGCYEEVAYQPPDQTQQQAARPTDEVTSDTDTPTESIAESAEPITEEPDGSEAGPVARSSTPEFDEDDLLGDAVAEPQPNDARPADTPSEGKPESSTPAGGESLLPWENEGDRYRQADEARDSQPESGMSAPSAGESSASAPTTGSVESLLPWETPTEQASAAEPAPATAVPAEPEVAPPDPVVQPEPQQPEVDLPPVDVASVDRPMTSAQPAPQPGPTTSRHAAWLLGSKLSYYLLAPPEEAAHVEPELAVLASLLGVNLPEVQRAEDPSDTDGLARALAAGRQVGEQLSARHDPSHAALVEIAFKSNVLLAAYGKMPHLAHSIGGSVAAASVRAGLPESIWQPWQDSVASGGSVEKVQGAVLELHTQVDSYLRDPPAEATQAILR